MKIKITPFDNKDGQLEGEFRVGDNFYCGKHHSVGIVTKIRTDDKWLDEEMAWVSRSEIPFITSLRQSRVEMCTLTLYANLVSGGTPFIREEGPFFSLKDVNKFPSDAKCVDLIREHCGLVTDESYNLTDVKVKTETLHYLYKLFDYKNDLLIRAGSCLYKAYVLSNLSYTFAEEIYINTFIGLEAIVEYIKLRDGLEGLEGKKEVVEKIGELDGMRGFKDYEEEMRDGIRHNIMHPFRDKYAETIAQPVLSADSVFEDLAFVDWLFKQVLLKKL